jgi:hypothetical protein
VKFSVVSLDVAGLAFSGISYFTDAIEKSSAVDM